MTKASDEAISAVAHELKTPLAVITGYAELLGARDDERTRREAAPRILEAAERLAGAVDRLLLVVTGDEALAQRLAAARERLLPPKGDQS